MCTSRYRLRVKFESNPRTWGCVYVHNSRTKVTRVKFFLGSLLQICVKSLILSYSQSFGFVTTRTFYKKERKFSLVDYKLNILYFLFSLRLNLVYVLSRKIYLVLEGMERGGNGTSRSTVTFDEGLVKDKEIVFPSILECFLVY